jgi:hypothetical protein
VRQRAHIAQAEGLPCGGTLSPTWIHEAPVSVQATRGTETGATEPAQSLVQRGFPGGQTSAKAPQNAAAGAQKWLAHHLAEPSRKGRLAA